VRPSSPRSAGFLFAVMAASARMEALAATPGEAWGTAPWVRWAGAVLAVAAAVLVCYWQLRRQRRRERELEQRLEKSLGELRRSEERRRREQKLESLETLAGGIAHDFNNLLVGVLGNAELARMTLEPGSPVAEYLDEIELAAHRATTLSKKMLAYSGKGRFVTTQLDLSSAVDEVAPALSLPRRVRLERRLHPDLPAVRADAAQVHQLLTNLIVNAAEALDGREHGAITVTTGSRHCDRRDLARTFLDDDLKEGLYAFVEVRDDGPGIDAEAQARIFDPFFTTKTPGRGLGLPVVLGIVRGHRGALELASEPGRGTCVRVLLPASEEAVSDVSEGAEAAWRGSGKVLLIDDEALVLRTAGQMLELLGFEVFTAEDGEDGVELFRRHADEIALVVLDLTMPRMSGEEAFQAIRRIRPAARVLLASGYERWEATEHFAGQGLAGFIHKPFQLSTLRDKVCRALDHSALDSPEKSAS